MVNFYKHLTPGSGKYYDCVYYLLKRKPLKNVIDHKSILFNVWFRQNILRKFEMPYLEMFITTKCNLRCNYCSNLIPNIECPEHINKESIFRTIDKLLLNIDRLYRLKLHGGEIFLHPQLSDIIEYVGNKKKILSFRLVTNGTIIPDGKILEIIKIYGFVIQISDYHLPNTKAGKLIQKLEEKGVPYVFLKNQEWRDMGNFEKRENNRCVDCSITRCLSLLEDKIFICSRSAMMNKQQILQSDYVNVFQKRKDFIKAMDRFYKNQSINSCLYCDGDTEFASRIPAGVQREVEKCR